jgi:DNA-binding beta-propeller fold protein YncE
VDLPRQAFQALPAADGCWIFVSLPVGDGNADDSSAAAVSVFSRAEGHITLLRTVPVGGNATGMTLTHDGRLLVIADGRRVAFVDIARATAGDGNAVLGYWSDGTPDAGRIYVNVTADDRHLFVSNENARTISVLDLAKLRASGFKTSELIGHIPVGNGPVAFTLSPDERYLYSTMLNMPPADVAYVSARGANELLAFDTATLVRDPGHALLGRVPTGPNPIGIAVVDGGRRVIVTNSNRFGAAVTEAQSLLVLDATKVSGGKSAVLGSIPAGALPREMRVTATGRTLLVVNSLSRKLQVIDIARLSYQ